MAGRLEHRRRHSCAKHRQRARPRLLQRHLLPVDEGRGGYGDDEPRLATAIARDEPGQATGHGSVGLGPALELVLSGARNIVPAQAAHGRKERERAIERLHEEAGQERHDPKLRHSAPATRIRPQEEESSADDRVRSQAGAHDRIALLKDAERPGDGRL